MPNKSKPFTVHAPGGQTLARRKAQQEKEEAEAALKEAEAALKSKPKRKAKAN